MSDPGDPRAARLGARATVPYAELQRRGNLPGRLTPVAEDRLRYEQRVTLFDQPVDVALEGRPVVQGDTVTVVPGRLQVGGGGVDLPEPVSREITDRLNLRLPVTGLPPGLEIGRLAVRPRGVEVVLTGSDVPVANLTGSRR